jgi:hypothetical protein
MYSANPASTDMQRAVDETIGANWVLFLTQGVILMTLGVLAVIWP